jgi:hypothetical protein
MIYNRYLYYSGQGEKKHMLNTLKRPFTQVFQSHLRILSEKIRSDIGLLRNQISSVEKPIGSDLYFIGFFTAWFRIRLRRKRYDRFLSNPIIGYCRNHQNPSHGNVRITRNSTTDLAGFRQNSGAGIWIELCQKNPLIPFVISWSRSPNWLITLVWLFVRSANATNLLDILEWFGFHGSWVKIYLHYCIQFLSCKLW